MKLHLQVEKMSTPVKTKAKQQYCIKGLKEKSKSEPWTEHKLTGFYCGEGKYCLVVQ